MIFFVIKIEFIYWLSYFNKVIMMSLEDIEKLHILPYKKDKFQIDGDKALYDGEDVLVVADTGCGKSTLAEFSIIFGLHTERQVIVTVPVIALALQYYYQYNIQYNVM